MIEINFDGLVGPTHNYAGLSLGNIASATNAGSVARPRAAALEGLMKMRRLMDLGLPQGFLLPHERPDAEWLRRMGFSGKDAAVCAAAWAADPALFRNACSASAMWTANAATVSPAPDTRDGRCHLTIANLSSMTHRSLEPPETERQLRTIFRDTHHFAVHAPVPRRFGDEGAANFMRMTTAHGAPGVEIFVYGAEREPPREIDARTPAKALFPSRQSRRASEAVARLHGLDPARTFFAQQSDAAIQAGAFHNDVVAVANETLLFAHEQAFENKNALYDFVTASVPEAVIVEVPAARVSLEDAIRSYLFNSQLLTLGDGTMMLAVPAEVREHTGVWAWVQDMRAGNGPIRAVEVIDVRESMRNGGGPACLRLRVAVDETARAAIDQRFLLDERKWDALVRLIEAYWPEAIGPDDLSYPDLWRDAWRARRALLDMLES